MALAIALAIASAPGAGARAATASAAATAAPRTLVYPRAETAGDPRDRYPVELLALALAKSAPDRYRLEPSRLFMLQVRSLHEVEAGGLDVMWTMTTAEREKRLRPVRVPIDRGLLGWRLFLVRDNAVPRFAGVRALDGLRPLRAGQGADWPDTDILRAAGLPVDASARYADLFRKLAMGRIDYFPRSMLEIRDEQAAHAAEGLVIEPRLALHYPTAMYFFVRRDDQALADDLARGLEAALRDGSMEALFDRHFGAAIRQADLARRTVIELPNPLLPPGTPLDDKRLWFRP